METNVKKVFIENAEDFENFNGERDFETSMKKFATNNYYKKGEK